MFYIQLPHGYVKNNKQVQFNLPSDYEESQYYKEVAHITNESPAVKNNILRNREDLKKWLWATSNYGNEIQEDLNAIIGYNEKINNAIVRDSLELKDDAISVIQAQLMLPLTLPFTFIKLQQKVKESNIN